MNAGEYDIPIAPQIVKLHWTGLHRSAVRVFVEWCGGEEIMAENAKKLKDIVRALCAGSVVSGIAERYA